MGEKVIFSDVEVVRNQVGAFIKEDFPDRAVIFARVPDGWTLGQTLDYCGKRRLKYDGLADRIILFEALRSYTTKMVAFEGKG